MADVNVAIGGVPLILPPITQGQTWSPPGFTYLVGGVAVNLSTYTGELNFATGPLPAPVVQSCTTANGLLTLSSGGQIVPSIPASTTIGIPGAWPGGLQYWWELKLVDSSGNVSKPVAGTVLVYQTIAT